VASYPSDARRANPNISHTPHETPAGRSADFGAQRQCTGPLLRTKVRAPGSPVKYPG